MDNSQSTFLAAEWRHLAMLNFEVDPAAVRPLVPAGTELDDWRGHTFVSLVGFLFLNTRVYGMGIPLHRNFEEVNLRFYVRRMTPDGWRRAVVFVKELVPRTAIALIAKLLYGENYAAAPMSHALEVADGNEAIRKVTYAWRYKGRKYAIHITASGEAEEIAPGTEAEFITEHYWGYSRQRDGGTIEYQVKHPRWRVWNAREACMEGDFARLYGEQFAGCLNAPPTSAFLAEGSAVTVARGTRLPLKADASGATSSGISIKD